MNSPTDVAGVYHLTRFIAVILRDAGLSNWYFAAYGALYLLKKLKSRFPKARGSCGFRLFLASFMIASKTMSDIAHTNGEWAEMGMSLFSTKVLFRMECEMFNYLDWKLIIRSEELEHFIAQVQREFGSHLYD
ncbi:hypothetical protein BKA62DRAFT_43841 [Auriculariales sp. MPI-PUGE-AT-0066]|nr:hypothetical protein BKA62DRAFT_43841 [Auriculariales sp. MPI-PUGE-AT-0066]